MFVQLDAAKIHTEKKPTIFKSHYTIVCCDCQSTELGQEPISVLGRNIVVAQGWGARSSASANWCGVILKSMELHSFTYLKILCLYVCCRVWVFLLVSKYRTINWNMWVLCYCIWHNYATCIYRYRKWNLCIPVTAAHVIQKWQMASWSAVILHLPLSDSILGLYVLGGVPYKNILMEISVFIIWVNREGFWFLVLNYWHWSFSSCSNFQEVNFFTFILGLKLKTLQFMTMKRNLNINCNSIWIMLANI